MSGVIQKLKKTIIPSYADNQQFLDHFNQYINQEWRSYYFAYDLMKKEYHRLKSKPNACGLYENQLLQEMKRVHRFLLRVLTEIEDDFKIVTGTIDALQLTLSTQSEEEIHQVVTSMEENSPQIDGTPKFIDPANLPHPKTNPVAFLKKSVTSLVQIAQKVETIVLDEDQAKRKKKQLDHNVELALRSIYAMLSRCEQYYKLNSYAIRKVGKRMEKLYSRRPMEEIPSKELIFRKSTPGSIDTNDIKRRASKIIRVKSFEQEDFSVREHEITNAMFQDNNTQHGIMNLNADSIKFSSPPKVIPPKDAFSLKKSWKDTPSGVFFYDTIGSLGEKITELKGKCVDLYSIKFKKANVDLAAYELEFVENHDRNYRNTSSFITFKLGLIVCITVWLATDSLSTDETLDFWDQPSIYVYTTIFNILLYRLFWGIDIAVWTQYGVNFISVLELSNVKSNLLFVINQTTTLMTLFFISLLIFYRANSNKAELDNSFVSYGSPMLLLVISISIQIFQTFFYYKHDSSRGIFNRRVMINMISSPLVALTFRDAYGADVLTSFTKIIADSLYASCWVVSGSFLQSIPNSEDGSSAEEQQSSHFGSNYLQCKSHNMVLVVSMLQLVPLMIRFHQCLRAFYENKYQVFPFLFNAWKYLLSMIVVVFAIEGWGNTNSYIFLVVMTTLYKSWWDVAMDWGLFEVYPEKWTDLFDINNYLHGKLFLRSSLMYPYASGYYFSIVLNLFLRFIWVLSLAPMSFLGGLVGAKLSLFMGSMEIIRRSIWGVFRIEWEHIKLLRNDSPGYLPTHVLRKHEWSSKYSNKSVKSKSSTKEEYLEADGPPLRRNTSIWMEVAQEDLMGKYKTLVEEEEDESFPMTLELPSNDAGLDLGEII